MAERFSIRACEARLQGRCCQFGDRLCGADVGGTKFIRAVNPLGAVLRQVASDDDLRLGIDGGLGVVGLDEADAIASKGAEV